MKNTDARSRPGTNEDAAPEQEIVLPPGTPSWITVDRVRDTMRVFGPRMPEPVTVDVAIEMLNNVGRLADWLYMTRPKPRTTAAPTQSSSASSAGLAEGECARES